MSLILMDTGAVKMLTAYFKSGETLKLKLFTNNITPLDSHTPADYTEVVTGAPANYVSKDLVTANWTISIVSNIAQAIYTQQPFNFDAALAGGLSVRGYFVVDSANTLVWAEQYATPYTPQNTGGTLLVTPLFKLSKGDPT
jgi:hypothetical protein